MEDVLFYIEKRIKELLQAIELDRKHNWPAYTNIARLKEVEKIQRKLICLTTD